MAYRKATFEEYQKASQFAQIRYKVGVYVNIVAVILLLFLAYYTFTNIEEMKANPVYYAEEKLGVICDYQPQNVIDFDNIDLLDYNGSRGNITGIEEG